MSLNNEKVLLIPAAGFGRRVGSPEAKEMLKRKCISAQTVLSADLYVDQPLIKLPLSLAQDCGARAHVMTRKEKQSLCAYLDGSGRKINPNLSVQLVGETKEWPETLMLSEPYWGDLNVVCLPDTDFAPLSVVMKMFEIMCPIGSCALIDSNLSDGEVSTKADDIVNSDADIVFATFKTNDYKTWGVVDLTTSKHCEKPTTWTESARAWGLFGFKRESGLAILDQMLASTFDHNWRPIKGTTKFVCLDEFKDLTR